MTRIDEIHILRSSRPDATLKIRLIQTFNAQHAHSTFQVLRSSSGGSRVANSATKSGAPDGSNLEPQFIDATLQTLEEWAEFLRHDDVLLQTLASFEETSKENDENGISDISSSPEASS